MEVAIVQHNPMVGDVSGNCTQIIEAYRQATDAGAKLVVTPELALFGYPPRDLLHRRRVRDAEQTALDDLRRVTEEGPPLIVGHTASANQTSGPPLTNSATVFDNGEVTGQYSKRLLPTYDIFDEHRYFSRGTEPEVVHIKDTTVGITICEDAWYDHEVTGQRRHQTDPIAPYEDEEVDLLVNLSASPYRVNKPSSRQERFGRHAERIDAPVVFANQVGGNDDILFDGTSFILDADGSPIVSATSGEPRVLIGQPKNNSATASIPSETTQLRRMLELGIRDYLDKTGFDDVIIGISGGIDSSVAAALAAEAIGPAHVHGITLPSAITAESSRTDAERVAQNLGIQFNEIGIEQLSKSLLDAINGITPGDDTRGITRENVQARVRGLLLMGVANDLNALVLTPDNKSEAAVGYCTLYGDAVGAIAPLGDCTKRRVYALAEDFNTDLPTWTDSAPIPSSVLEKAPTAELAEGQIDADDIPPYEVTDAVVKQYVGNKHNLDQIVQETTATKQQVKTVIEHITRSEFKRHQTPPALRVTTKAFDSGWRYPIAASYAEILTDS
ncbi:MAG: NAD+ synthetase [Haloquadratum walsbyi J07HQW2]|uniref:Glutamine-dependent NAD(+) synthetase n=2 Tax=Haloquadratum walsbyi TaxID=293091 RepID=U1MWF7_9EURY|nr:MAG: NAD+ synthetase [Haloquadratum walsbyi J07HQW2]